MIEPIHYWFELSYASYLVLPRSVLQSMPVEWQRQFVDLLEQIPETLELPCSMPDYRVNAHDSTGSFIKDPYRDYRYQSFPLNKGGTEQ